MVHRLARQWVLPGGSSRYLLVRWFEQAARDARDHVSASQAIRMLDGWLASHRSVLRETREALEELPSIRLSARGGDDAQLKACLVEALRSGRLVVLHEERSSSGADSASHGQAPLLSGPMRSTSRSHDVVALDLEWTEDLIARLSADVSLVLTRGGQPPQTYSLGAASRAGGTVRLSLGEFRRAEKISLTARKGPQELVLLRDQPVGNPKSALVWEHALEELLETPEAPGSKTPVKTGQTPADAQTEPDTATILEV